MPNRCIPFWKGNYPNKSKVSIYSFPRGECMKNKWIAAIKTKDFVSAAYNILTNSSLSFIQSFTLLHTAFTIQIATPGGKSLEFINQDEQRRRWLNDFRMKPFSIPISLQTIDPNRYSCLVIPHAPGATLDLVDDSDLGQILKHFVKEKKPICAVGMGVVGLFSAIEDDHSWCFRRYVLTSTSVFEMAKSSDFEASPIIPEDVIKDRGAQYSCTEPDEVHVIVDRHLVTGQNEQSTLTAIQNLVLLCNQKQGKNKQDRH